MFKKKTLWKLTLSFMLFVTVFFVTITGVNADAYKGYSDVSPGDTHYEAIKALSELNVINGYEDGTFRQWKGVHRKHAAVLLFNELKAKASKNQDDILKQYSDINSNHEYAKEIAAMTEAGIFRGSNGKFNPDKLLTREQMATILVYALDLDKYNYKDVEEVLLGNVDPSHKENVQVIADLGITNQLNNYRPHENVSRGAFASLLYSAHEIVENEEKGTAIQILGINDFHGQIDKTQKIDGRKAGSAPYLAAYLKQAEKENPNTLKVHAGDIVGASSPTSALLQDEPTIEILNELKFDVGTLGNHEFDQGTEELKRLLDGGHHETTGDFEGANFPYVAANSVYKDTGENILPPYTIKEVDGVKIGIIGVYNGSRASIATSAIENVVFTDQTKAINDAAKELKEQGIKAIIVLAHTAAYSNPDGSGAKGQMVDIAKDLDEEIDVIFAGHNHDFTNTVVNNKLIVQSIHFGVAFSKVNVLIDPRTKDIARKSGEIITTYQDEISPDPTVEKMVEGYKNQVGPLIDREVGFASEEITTSTDESGESGLGNLVTDAQRIAMNADFSFTNMGGIRTDLDKGKITWGSLFTMQPFGDSLVSMTYTGAQVKTILEQQFRENRNSVLPLSGIHYTWSKEAPIGNKVSNMTDRDGTPIDPEKRYKIAMNEFLAGGGDGYTEFANGTDRELGMVDLDALVEYIESFDGPIKAPKLDRITLK